MPTITITGRMAETKIGSVERRRSKINKYRKHAAGTSTPFCRVKNASPAARDPASNQGHPRGANSRWLESAVRFDWAGEGCTSMLGAMKFNDSELLRLWAARSPRM